MADISTIKNEMHTASCAELLVLRAEADVMVSETPELLNWFLHHVYKEYNKRRFNLCGGTEMIEPYNGGFIPIGYVPSGLDDGDFLLLEAGDAALLQNGDFILLEQYG